MRHTKFLLCLILILALLMPAAGLSEADVMTPYGKYPETVVLRTAKRSDAQPNLLPGDDVANNPMTRYIKDKVNVEIQVDWEVEGSEFANKLSLMLVSGSLPDMFTLGAGDYLLFRQLMENDMLEDLSSAYEACANDHIKNTIGPNGSYDGRNLDPFYGEDGKLYAFAGGRYGYEHNQLWLREDWLQAAGLSAPKTIDDLANILRTWKENPPVENYTAMPLHHLSVGGVYDGMSASPIFAAFHAYPGAWIEDENGEIVWGSTMPGVKEGLRVLAEWYKEGLIDQQFVTRTAGGVKEALITGGQAGAAFAPWWFVYPIGDFPKNNPDGLILPHNAPLDADGKFNITFPGAAGDYVMVRKGYEHPEAIFKVINCEFDMWRQFDEEAANLIQATRDNNVSWTYLFPTSGFNVEPNDVIPVVGNLARAMVETGSIEGVESGNPMNIDMAKRAAQYAKDGKAEGMNWIDYYGRYIASNLMDTPEVNIIYPAYSFVTESMADLKPNLDTLEQTTFLKIVVGELPVDAFDQFVEDWHAQGGQRMIDEVKAMIK